jgi:glycosyltransferase involved in cell wall biosynthesis
MSAQPPGFPDWSALTAGSAVWRARQPGRRGRALIASNIGGHGPVSMMESMLAAALAVRDMDVEIVLCDGILPGCLRAEHSELPDPQVIIDKRLAETICGDCIWRGRSMFEPLGLKVHYLSEHVSDAERAEAAAIAAAVPATEIATYSFDGIKIGEHARAGALRYFARGDLMAEPLGEPVLRRYLEASIIAARAYRNLLTARKFDVAVFHHGLYVPQGQVGEICRSLGVRVINWFVAYRENCFILSHGDTYHHTLMAEPTAAWETMPWGERQRRDIAAYLQSRWHGARDWIGFHEKPTDDVAAFAQQVGLDLSKPTIGLLTNVVWDAQLHYPANAFPSLLDWLRETITYFGGRPDLQLLIRIHPAEIRGTARSRQPVADEITKWFQRLPSNVFVIPPDSPVSTYAAMAQCDSVLIYGTKTGVELTAVGIPTVVAGEAWIKNKGLTLDARSREDYRALLDRLPLGQRLEPQVVERAQKYAYHFFFRRMIPLHFMRRDNSALFFKPDIASVDDLAPGKDAGLDVMCDGIMTGTPFIYPAETLGLHDRAGVATFHDPQVLVTTREPVLTVVLNTLINPSVAGGSESSALSILVNFRDAGPSEINMLATVLPPYEEQMQVIRGDAAKVIRWPWPEFTVVPSTPQAIWARRLRAHLGGGVVAKVFDNWSRSRNERAFLASMPSRAEIDAFLDRYNADVVHFTYPVTWPTRRPFIIEPHDIQQHHFPEFFSADVLHWRHRVYGEGIRNAAFVVCGTWWTKRDIMHHYEVPASKVAVIPRSSTMARATLTPNREAEVVAAAHLPATFAYYPAMTFPHKNHLRLFEAIALLRDRKGIKVNLVCTGRPYGPFHPTLLDAIVRQRLGEQVRFLGPVSDDLLTACYRRARFIMFPSLLEGHSQSLLESLYHHKPIVAAKQSSIPETVGAAGLLFDALDVEDIAAALERAWTEDGLLTDLAAKTEGSFERYRWDRAILTLSACYKQAVGRALTAEEQLALDRALLEHEPAA